LKRRNGEADKTDEGMILSQFGRAQAKAVLAKVLFHAIYHPIAFFPRKKRRHEFHNEWVRIQTRECFPVGLPPVAQDQAVCLRYYHEVSPTRMGVNSGPRGRACGPIFIRYEVDRWCRLGKIMRFRISNIG
jgi:hypothetical protein